MKESLQQFPYYDASGDIPKIENPLFAEGYGLSTAEVQISSM